MTPVYRAGIILREGSGGLRLARVIRERDCGGIAAAGNLRDVKSVFAAIAGRDEHASGGADAAVHDAPLALEVVALTLVQHCRQHPGDPVVPISFVNEPQL